MKKPFDPRRECECAVTEKSKNRFLAKWKNITDKSVIFKAVKEEEESHDAQDLPLPLSQDAEKFASKHKGGEVTMVMGFLESLHFSQNHVFVQCLRHAFADIAVDIKKESCSKKKCYCPKLNQFKKKNCFICLSGFSDFFFKKY